MSATPYIEVMHGVNLDMLHRRDPGHYGTLTLAQLQDQIAAFAQQLGLEVGFFQSNFEGEYIGHLHDLPDNTRGVILNPGAWTHYSWAIRDALELTGLPAVEVHLSDIKTREPWRALSVIEDLCTASFVGQGPEGYRLALERLASDLGRRRE